MNEAGNRQQLGNLNIIRVIAATCIIFHHYQQVFEITFNGINFYGGKFYFGFLVELFFMISGFLTIYSERKENIILQSLKRKYVRIVPFAWLSMACFLIITLLYEIIFHTILWNEKFTISQIITSFFMVNQGWMIEFFPALNNPTWYLNVLILCYIVYYTIKWLCKRMSISQIPMFVFLVVIAVTGQYLQISLPFFWNTSKRGYASFFIGVLLGKLFLNFEKRKIYYFAVIMAIFSICAIVLRGISDWYSLVLFVFPALLMMFLSIKQVDNRLLKNWGGII